jgi:CRP-like cAMP-binding protein
MLAALRARIAQLPLGHFAAGQTLLAAGTKTGRLLFLEEGRIAVVRDGVTITRVRERGAVFGEMSLLLDVPHTADVVALDATSCRVAEDAAALLLAHPELSAYVATVLAHRLDAATRYLVDVKAQLADAGNHLGMIDEVLGSLASRHPKALAGAPPVDPALKPSGR